MSTVYATPPRPGPGNYINTPFQQTRNSIPAPSFNQTPGPATRSQDLIPANQSQSQGAISAPASNQNAPKPAESLTFAERTGRTLNQCFDAERQQNALEREYSGRLTSEYEMRNPSIWGPFQKVRSYNIPDQIFEQLNHSTMNQDMGLFAEINYAWVTVDNALYMWDYTSSNPELLGYEDHPSVIQSVKLAKPRAGVFLGAIKHIIILASTDSILLLGLGVDPSNPQASISLFQTGMNASVKGLMVKSIAASETTGRIFFGSRTDNDLQELKYQAQDSWFSARCNVVNHTRSRYSALTGALTLFGGASQEHIKQIEVDDSRRLLYTLSSTSTIRAYDISPNGDSVDFRCEITMPIIAQGVDPPVQPHVSGSKIVSISSIPAQEASTWIIMATTVSGYRIYLRGSFSASYVNAGSPHQSLQAFVFVHIRTPPILPSPDGSKPSISQSNSYLTAIATARRFSPGYFFASVAKSTNAAEEQLFVSASDIFADQSYQRLQQGMPEVASWVEITGAVMDIGYTVPYKSPTSRPEGFGYENAVQFDQPVPEVALLTNTGVHILRRKRLVDSLAALIRQGGGQEGFQTELNNLIVKYGRQEILANALAVACGQSIDTTSDRSLRINDPEVLETARKIYIEQGGRPSVDQNAASNLSAPVDAVRPSPRYEASARYVARLVRSVWGQQICTQAYTPAGLQILCSVPATKLRTVQETLSALKKFFDSNKNFISGLSGPDDSTRQASKEDEISLQGENRAFVSLVKFLSAMIEAISFVLVLFEERVQEIVPLLPQNSKDVFMAMTFAHLVSTDSGSRTAKDLVKAIVNRNIAKGSNVETIAESLRRKCGEFCSANDVVIFKAQEQQSRAEAAKDNAEYSRNLLNESLKLFVQVAESLSQEYLRTAVDKYVELQFYAGAISLSLQVAQQHDKTNEALAWINDSKPANDRRADKYALRNQCYDLIHNVLEAIDESVLQGAPFVDGRPSLASVRREEAYDVMSRSKDEVFFANLYDWYLSKHWYDRLLATDSGFIVKYLEQKARESVDNADLLWQYFGQKSQYHEAAKVQLDLAQSNFNLPLDRRLEYLSRARANASAFTTANSTVNRKTKQKLLTEINSLVEVANIQDELLSRLRGDSRLTEQNREQVLNDLDGPVKTISDLYNGYADSAGYFDICLLIYAVADHRDASQIKNTWAEFLRKTTDDVKEAMQANPNTTAYPYEMLAERFRELAGRLRSSEAVFPVVTLIEMLERYSINEPYTRQAIESNNEPAHWIPDIFIELEVPYELVYDSLEGNYVNLTQVNAKLVDKRIVLSDLLYTVARWQRATSLRAGQLLFGGEQGQARIEELLLFLTEQQSPKDIGQNEWNWARQIRNEIESFVA